MTHPHISRTLEPGNVGTMPPRPPANTEDGMKVIDLTKKQLITVCDLRGVTMPNGRPIARFQKKGFYIQRMKAADKAGVLSDDEIEVLATPTEAE